MHHSWFIHREPIEEGGSEIGQGTVRPGLGGAWCGVVRCGVLVVHWLEGLTGGAGLWKGGRCRIECGLGWLPFLLSQGIHA
jgi:hypothetical protein